MAVLTLSTKSKLVGRSIGRFRACATSQGPAGASGDLAPLAQLSSVPIGDEDARIGGRALSLALQTKEGVALLKRMPVSTVFALVAMSAAEQDLAAASRILTACAGDRR